MGPLGSLHWSATVPGASNLLCMVKTLRERGNEALAEQLEVLAKKQSEVQLRYNASLAASDLLVSGYQGAETCIVSEEGEQNVALEDSDEPEEEQSGREERRDEYETCSLYSWVSEDNWQSDFEEFTEDEEGEEQQQSVNEIGDSTAAGTTTAAVVDPLSQFHQRLETFSCSRFRWSSPSPAELAEAGFAYVGPRDCVQCFLCRSRQNFWLGAEDPWVRHARQSPKCDYVLRERGTDFLQCFADGGQGLFLLNGK